MYIYIYIYMIITSIYIYIYTDDEGAVLVEGDALASEQ